MSERAHYAVERQLLVIAIVDVNHNEAGMLNKEIGSTAYPLIPLLMLQIYPVLLEET